MTETIEITIAHGDLWRAYRAYRQDHDPHYPIFWHTPIGDGLAVLVLPAPKRTCVGCGKGIDHKRAKARHCGPACRRRAAKRGSNGRP